MRRRSASALIMLVVAAVLLIGGCSTPAQEADTGTPPASPDVTAPGGDAAGTRLAPGLYDQPDGSVMALGTLEWSDIEGGFWAIIGGTEADGDVGKVVVVLANIPKTDTAYSSLEGKTVQVTGSREEGASIRMAGPEMTATAITEISDTPGPAE